jgi:NAD(P)-dependent dehydrogenase (short-subunit alcohol dehydrogenase family)
VHGVRVNIVAPGPADTEPGLPGAAVPESGTCVLPITIASAALTRSTPRVVVIGDEIGVAV